MTRYHVVIPSTPAPLHWARLCDRCGLPGTHRSLRELHKSMKAADIAYQVAECTCPDACGCAEAVDGGEG